MGGALPPHFFIDLLYPLGQLVRTDILDALLDLPFDMRPTGIDKGT